jgi:hypothetical protein
LKAAAVFHNNSGHRVAAALHLAVGIAPAAAQPAGLATLLQMVNKQQPPPPVPSLIPELLSRTQKAARAEGRCVPTSVTVAPLQPASASQEALPMITHNEIKNAWTTSAQAVGCPGALPERFLVLRLPPDDAVRIIGVVAGTTLTSFAQMKQASPAIGNAALAAAQAMEATCTSEGMDILSTRLVREHPGLGPDFYGVRLTGSWDEVWTLTLCKGQATVPVTFKADGNGGADPSIDPRTVRFIRP